MGNYEVCTCRSIWSLLELHSISCVALQWESSERYSGSSLSLSLSIESERQQGLFYLSQIVNDRWGRGISCQHGDVYTCDDRYNPGRLLPHKWENCFTASVKNLSNARSSPFHCRSIRVRGVFVAHLNWAITWPSEKSCIKLSPRSGESVPSKSVTASCQYAVREGMCWSTSVQQRTEPFRPSSKNASVRWVLGWTWTDRPSTRASRGSIKMIRSIRMFGKHTPMQTIGIFSLCRSGTRPPMTVNRCTRVSLFGQRIQLKWCWVHRPALHRRVWRCWARTKAH